MIKAFYSLFTLITTVGMILTSCNSGTTTISHPTTAPTKPQSQNTDFFHYNPDPIQQIIHHDAKSMQMHLFDGADSVWLDGDWHDTKTNLFGPRYVSTYVNTSGNPPKSVVEEWDSNSPGQGHTDHVCPKIIGHITITAIDTDGPKKWLLVHFTSSSGVNGTLDLSNNQWTFNAKIWTPNHRTARVSKEGYDTVFLDSEHGWKMDNMVGAAGSVSFDLYQTTDGGSNWNKISYADNMANSPIPFNGDKNGMSFVNVSTGWITGSSNNAPWIFVTHDGGHTWKHQDLPFPSYLKKVDGMQFELTPPTFFTSEDGILIEKIDWHFVFLFTHDGGQSWQWNKDSSSGHDMAGEMSWNFSDVDKGSVQNGTVTVNESTWKTTDGGYTWTQ